MGLRISGTRQRGIQGVTMVSIKSTFHLVLKEGEWRFNYRPVANLNKTLQQWSFKSKSKPYLCQTL